MTEGLLWWCILLIMGIVACIRLWRLCLGFDRWQCVFAVAWRGCIISYRGWVCRCSSGNFFLLFRAIEFQVSKSLDIMSDFHDSQEIFELSLEVTQLNCHQIKRHGGKINGGEICINLVHSIFTMMDVMEPACCIVAILPKQCIKSFVKGLHLLELFWIVTGNSMLRILISEMEDWI